jgi:uncharacterized membrane protein SirB2
MPLIDWYPQIKQAHIGLVTTSGLLFAVRGAAVLAHQDWAMRTSWRRLSYGIDTLLLTAGITLWSLLGLNPVGNSPWLGTKLVLLLVYIVLGSVALKRGRSDGARRVAYIAALAIYGFMASVAVKHHPLGVWMGG